MQSFRWFFGWPERLPIYWEILQFCQISEAFRKCLNVTNQSNIGHLMNDFPEMEQFYEFFFMLLFFSIFLIFFPLWGFPPITHTQRQFSCVGIIQRELKLFLCNSMEKGSNTFHSRGSPYQLPGTRYYVYKMIIRNWC